MRGGVQAQPLGAQGYTLRECARSCHRCHIASMQHAGFRLFLSQTLRECARSCVASCQRTRARSDDGGGREFEREREPSRVSGEGA
jgi:hypothetical protein